MASAPWSHWLEVSVTTDGEGTEAVADALRPFAHDGSVVMVELDDPHQLDVLEPAYQIAVKVYIQGDLDVPELRLRLRRILFYLSRLYPIPEPVFAIINAVDGNMKHPAHDLPYRAGKRLWIQSSSQAAMAAPENDFMLTLDAGMAFGTGLHPTTQLCLLELESLMKPGMKVLDIGSGSGVLSILAAKMGASEVFGVDTSMAAVEAAQQNVRLSDVAQQVTIEQGELMDVVEKDWDLVFVNITAKVIDNLLRKNDLIGYVTTTDCLILSGIVRHQTYKIEAAIEVGDGHLDHSRSMGKDWMSFVVNHKHRLR